MKPVLSDSGQETQVFGMAVSMTASFSISTGTDSYICERGADDLIGEIDKKSSAGEK